MFSEKHNLNSEDKNDLGKEKMDNQNEVIFNKMTYYYDRWENMGSLDIANKCLENCLYLWNNYSMTPDMVNGNIFLNRFSGEDARTKNEYLFTMDYMSSLLSAYKMTNKEAYKDKFLELYHMFIEYIDQNDPLNNGIELDLPVLGQVVLIIKAVDILGKLSSQDKIQDLFNQYAGWLMDRNAWIVNNNHGLLQIMAQFHLSVCMSDSYPIQEWRKSAIEHLQLLYKSAYYGDYINNEHSLRYFSYNNDLYTKICDFCNYYKIEGIKEIHSAIEETRKALNIFAHSDGSFPVIGDGRIFYGNSWNMESKLFPEGNIAVVKIDELYFSFKNRTEFQSHAHIDLTSITARYKNIDFLIDSGQYNYDRYTPINRFVRSAAGHSSIFPLYADGLFLLDFCNRISYSRISDYDKDSDRARVVGEYKLDDVAITREIKAERHTMVISDSWKCEKPTAIRQRFVIPQVLLENSRFSYDAHLLESKVEGVHFKYQIITDIPNTLTTVQFGVAAPEYNMFETTMLLDTIAENTTEGKITAVITFEEE